MHARRVIVVLVYIFLVLLSLAVAKRYTSDKRVQNLSTFKTMMRYGRSGASPNQKENKVNIHPRADAFFLGPRYGKRSSWSPNASLVYPVSSPLCGLDEDLSCAYTGISDLYRCTPRYVQPKYDSTIFNGAGCSGAQSRNCYRQIKFDLTILLKMNFERPERKVPESEEFSTTAN